MANRAHNHHEANAKGARILRTGRFVYVGMCAKKKAVKVDQPRRVVMTDEESRQLSDLFVDILEGR
jgi:hypothetical protein